MMTTTASLYKIITEILKYTDIKGILYFGLTCRGFYILSSERNTALWRYQFFQRWPSLKTICMKKFFNKNINFKQEFERRINCRRMLLNYIETKNESHWHWDDLIPSDLENFDPNFREDKDAYFMNYYYLEDELIEILDRRRGIENANLTHEYYAAKILSYMKQCRLKNKWEIFINLPSERQVLEQAFGIAKQWCELKTRVSTSCLKVKLDAIANRALKYLQDLEPKSPILSKTFGFEIAFWRDHNINDNYWKPVEAKKILKAVHYAVLEDYNSRLTNNDIVWPNDIAYSEENMPEIILYASVIFHAVARRFGIRCDVLQIENCIERKFFLIWRENYSDYLNLGSFGNEYFYTLEVLSPKFTLQKHQFPAKLNNESCSLEDLASYTITCKNLMLVITTSFREYLESLERNRAILEFRHMIEPSDKQIILCLTVNLIRQNLKDYNYIWDILQPAFTAEDEAAGLNYTVEDIINDTIINMAFHIISAQNDILRNPPRVMSPKLRGKRLTYAIGMIVQFCIDESDFIGVIFGWTQHFDLKLILQNDKDIEANKRNRFHVSFNDIFVTNQPYYMILANNNAYYISQDLITPFKTTNGIINHDEIGRYFNYYKGTHYVPSQVLAKLYPHDDRIRQQWLSWL